MPRKRGRKPKFKKIYAKRLRDFFDIPSIVIEKDEIVYKNGTKKVTKREIPNTLPTIEKFARSIKVATSTVKNWAEAKTKAGNPKYPEFLESYITAKEIQKDIWLELSLRGFYNPYFAGLVGKNMFGWKDKQEVEAKHSGNLIVKRVSYKWYLIISSVEMIWYYLFLNHFTSL